MFAFIVLTFIFIYLHFLFLWLNRPQTKQDQTRQGIDATLSVARDTGQTTLLYNLIVLWTQVPIPLPILQTWRTLCSIPKTCQLMDHSIPFFLSQIYGQFKPVATEGVS